MPNILKFILIFTLIAGAGNAYASTAGNGSDGVHNPRPMLVEPIYFSVPKMAVAICAPYEASMTPKQKNLEVYYELMRGKGEVATSTLEYTMPVYSNNGLFWWYPDRSFRELEIHLNGKHIEYNKSTQALFGNYDITEELGAYGLDPNLIGENSGLTGTSENIRRYSELINKKYFSILDDYGDSVPALIPRWNAANRYWVTFTSAAGDKIDLTYKHILFPGIYDFNLSPANTNLPTAPAQFALKRIKLTTLDLSNLFGSVNDNRHHVFISWYIIPVANFAQYVKVGSVTVKVSSGSDLPVNSDKRIIFVRLGDSHIYSGSNEIEIHEENYIFENDIWVIVLDRGAPSD